MSPTPDVLNWLCATVRRLQADIKVLQKSFHDEVPPVLNLVAALQPTLNADADEFYPHRQVLQEAHQEPDSHLAPLPLRPPGVHALQRSHHLSSGSADVAAPPPPWVGVAVRDDEHLHAVQKGLASVQEAVDAMESTSAARWQDLRQELQVDVVNIAEDIGKNVVKQMSDIFVDEFKCGRSGGIVIESFHELFVALLPVMEKSLHQFEPVPVAAFFGPEELDEEYSEIHYGPHQILASADLHREVMAKLREYLGFNRGSDDDREWAQVVNDHIAKDVLCGDLESVANEIFDKILRLLDAVSDPSDCSFPSGCEFDDNLDH